MTPVEPLPDAQMLTRLDSVACILEWTRSMTAPNRKRFLNALIDGDSHIQHTFESQLELVKRPNIPSTDRMQAWANISDALHLGSSPDAEEFAEYSTTSSSAREETFAGRLKEHMTAKQISQQELAERIGCTQPAISQMLSRKRRPQKQTILKLAEALHVQPRELWPDIEATEMLDAVASFQQDDYTMTAAEADALVDTAKKNRPKIRAQKLPTRP